MRTVERPSHEVTESAGRGSHMVSPWGSRAPSAAAVSPQTKPTLWGAGLGAVTQPQGLQLEHTGQGQAVPHLCPWTDRQGVGNCSCPGHGASMGSLDLGAQDRASTQPVGCDPCPWFLGGSAPPGPAAACCLCGSWHFLFLFILSLFIIAKKTGNKPKVHQLDFCGKF